VDIVKGTHPIHINPLNTQYYYREVKEDTSSISVEGIL